MSVLLSVTKLKAHFLALFLAFIISLGCSQSEETHPVLNLGQGDYRLSTSQDHADGRITTSELIFDSPHSWRIISDPVLGDMILISDRAWREVDGTWQEFDGEAALALIETRVQSLTLPLLKDARRTDGPPEQGESTSQWTMSNVPIGRNMASALRKLAATSPSLSAISLMQADEIDDSTATIEILANEAGRVLRMRVTSNDGRLPSLLHVVDYLPTEVGPPN